MDTKNPMQGTPPPFVAIWTTGRAGSSAVAGALAELGVDFGPPFVGGRSRAQNPTGTFEDTRVQALVDMIPDGVTAIGAPGSPLRQTVTEGWIRAWRDWGLSRATEAISRNAPAFGAKYPGLAYCWPAVWPALDHAGVTDVRLVVVRRDPTNAAASYAGAFGHSTAAARAIVYRRQGQIDAALEDTADPVLELDFVDVIGDPRDTVERLAEHVFDASWFTPAPDDLDAAAATIDPGLVRHGRR